MSPSRPWHSALLLGPSQKATHRRVLSLNVILDAFGEACFQMHKINTVKTREINYIEI